MTLIEVKNKLREMRIPLLHTHEAAKILNLSNSQASLALHRLQKSKEVLLIKKGLWLIDLESHLFLIGEHLTRPYPAYISLQSALYLHGMISQIPETVYVVTLGRSQRKTVRQTLYSFHRIEVSLFKYFEIKENFHIASPEKALFDFFYFSATSQKIFKSLPELELPKNFKIKKLSQWSSMIQNQRLRSHVQKKIKALVLATENTKRTPTSN